MAISTFSVNQLDKDVIACLSHVCADQQVLSDFAKYLRGCYANLDEFLRGLREFMVAIKCASASDKNLFKRELEMDAMLAELMAMVDGEEKSAIKAEELDILAGLGALKL
jgi:hypothetical protein